MIKLPRLAHQRLAPEPPDPIDAATVASLIERLNAAAQTRLGHGLAIRHVNAGSCGGCELEVRALTGVLFGLSRFGLRFVDSPRHADVLLVTGAMTRGLRQALEQAYDATPDPKWVVAVGDCAVDGGVFKGSYAIMDGIGAAVPVDLTINGCPPSPARILSGLRALLEANNA